MRTFPLACMVLGSAAFATPAFADDSQAWATATVQAGLGAGWRVHNEVVYRSSDARGLYEIEQNLMLGYKANKHVTLWLGYTFDPNFNHGSLTTTEHRFRQQVNFDNVTKIGPFTLGGRMRVESRWRDAAPGNAWRLRPQVKLVVPIYGKTTLSISHESFINLNTSGYQRAAGYERMRNAVAISVPLVKHVSVELGYLEQHGFVRNGPDTDDHVATVGLSASF